MADAIARVLAATYLAATVDPEPADPDGLVATLASALCLVLDVRESPREVARHTLDVLEAAGYQVILTKRVE